MSDNNDVLRSMHSRKTGRTTSKATVAPDPLKAYRDNVREAKAASTTSGLAKAIADDQNDDGPAAA